MRQKIIAGQKVHDETWIESINELSNTLEYIRLLVVAPKNLELYILYQELVVRKTAARLYRNTLEEAIVLQNVITSNTLDDRTSEQLIQIRKQADKERKTLKLLEIALRQDNTPGIVSTHALQKALNTSKKAFELFDEIRRNIYASTLLEENNNTLEIRSMETGTGKKYSNTLKTLNVKRSFRYSTH